MKKVILLQIFFLCFYFAKSQPPAGYYDAAQGLTGNALKMALHNIIKNHTVLSYSFLWTAFQTTDVKPNGKVWDIYSDVPNGTPPYEYTFVTDQCGTYSAEGDCYNREHSFPASWFNDASPMYTDLFHIYPTDGWVNNKRSNYPYGNVGSATWTSLNGSKLGTCSNPGYTGIVFEPIDEYKGDLARTYFYMAVRYYTEDANWPGSNMVTGAEPKPWAINVLLNWHTNDPVSQKEIDRNNAIYSFQNNRNPFIDNPQWVWYIWGPTAQTQESALEPLITVYPNPASDMIHVATTENASHLKLQIQTISGSTIFEQEMQSEKTVLDVSDLLCGIYNIVISSDKARVCKKIVILR